MQSDPRQPQGGNVATSFVPPASPGAGYKPRATHDARPGSDPARKHPPSLCSLAACLTAALGLNVAHSGVAMTPLSVSVMRAPAQLRGAATKRQATPTGGFLVTNCNDSGSGSLRDIAGQAGEGSSIYLTALTCSTITLTSGAVNFLIDSVTLYGPGPDKLTIVGNGSDRVIGHGGSGTLSINGLTLTNGAITNSDGGCVYSSGSVRLYDTTVSSCRTYSTGSYTVLGGGVYARQALSISNSTITGNLVTGPSGHAYGGGAFVRGALDVFESTVSNNVASNSGGIASLGDVSISYSTISGNQANDNAGLALFAHYITQPFEINATTISGNVASNLIGGIGVLAETHIYNSTIADNRDGGRDLGAGLFGGASVAMYLESTIVAGNFSGTDRSDVGGYSGATLTGANNLVMTSNLTLPPDTLTSDPMLGPLASNGGPTLTHALLPGSPAIDAGNNIAAEFYDQRSNGSARLIGASADIGAYEVQSTGTRSTVTNCNDSGTGSLRDLVASALSGDSIDLSGLACSTITLTSGAIVVDQGTLTLAGPGSQALSIDGNDSDRVINHRGVGTLHLTGLSLTQGYYLADGEARGGCVNSASSLALIDISVSDCRIISAAPGALSAGGGLNAQHVNMQSSIVANNEAGATAALASGGGAYVRGNLSMYQSTISDNNAAGSAQNGSYEGGLFVGGKSIVVGSTIAGNRADGAGGAALLGASRIFNSTISGNQAFRAIVGGLVANQLSMYNSTVAFNTSSQTIGSGLLVAGVANLQSSIFFGNTGGTIEYDVGAVGYGAITGSHNLVGASPILLPADTIFSDPLLGPLQDNGGPTLTHALSPGSPAIDVGNNVANLETDQRGEGFVRVFGSAADIGAFEVQISDVIFRDGFD